MDCSGSVLSVALSGEKGEIVWSDGFGKGATERLMEAADFCLSRSGHARKELSLVACALGPGSFTGLRIGLSATKGIAEALDIPWIAIPTLDCHAWGLEVFPGAVIPVIDGRKGRFYSAVYERGTRVSPWLDISVAELAGKADRYDEVLFCGPDAPALEELCLERPGFRIFSRHSEPAALAMARMAPGMLALHGASSPTIGPLYLREAETGEIQPPASLGNC